MIFKIIETLILNANTTNTKQLFGAGELSGLSRNRPQAQNTPETPLELEHPKGRPGIPWNTSPTGRIPHG